MDQELNVTEGKSCRRRYSLPLFFLCFIIPLPIIDENLIDCKNELFWCSSPPLEFPRVYSWAFPSSLSWLYPVSLASCHIAFPFALRPATLYLYCHSSDRWEYDMWRPMGRAEFICSCLPDISSRMLVHHLKAQPWQDCAAVFSFFSNPAQYWQHSSDLSNKLLCELHITTMTWTNHIIPNQTAHNSITETFLQSFYLIHGAAAWVVLSVPSFPLSHCPSTLWARLYILKTKLILSGRDLDSCPCSLFWYNCPIIYPSSHSGLAVSFLPCGGMTFPSEVDESES